ncbi:GPP34 family phosphoprotein [Streptomyces sp. HPF1205]|uniref:GPP34 family phosphoprotein n=1 Tax=Streptomyces sp. HPF1205 TaxID=2873262 RepID=UPI001CEC1247|nr:GPP34 family phosphoprotein [Streptomyces sp. HPF1205]
MSTARDLALAALGLPPDRSVEQGDLSLALAGAEAVDLLASGALTLDGDRMVPGPPVATGDRLLREAAAALVRAEPYETVEDWLWRRGTDLAAVYADDLDRDGLLGRAPWHGLRARFARSTPADPPVHRRAEEHRAPAEPVLAALMAVLRIEGAPQDPDAGDATDTGGSDAGTDSAGGTGGNTDGSPGGDAVTTVLAAVGDAVARLDAMRLRRGIEIAAFDNMWRG